MTDTPGGARRPARQPRGQGAGWATLVALLTVSPFSAVDVSAAVQPGTVVSGPGAGPSALPYPDALRVAVAGDGTAVAHWEEGSREGRRLLISIRPGGRDPWMAPITPSVPRVLDPVVAAGVDGTIALTYVALPREGSLDMEIHVAVRRPGALTFDPPITLAPIVPPRSGPVPRVAVGQGGRVVVTWVDSRPRATLYAALRPDHGSDFGPATPVSAARGTTGSAVAFTKDDRPLAVWLDRNGPGGVRVRWSVADAGGRWQGARPLRTRGRVWGPVLAGSGVNPVLAWAEGELGAMGKRPERDRRRALVRVTRWDGATGSLTRPLAVSPRGVVSVPSVHLDGGGSPIVGWARATAYGRRGVPAAPAPIRRARIEVVRLRTPGGGTTRVEPFASPGGLIVTPPPPRRLDDSGAVLPAGPLVFRPVTAVSPTGRVVLASFVRRRRGDTVLMVFERRPRDRAARPFAQLSADPFVLDSAAMPDGRVLVVYERGGIVRALVV